jgi:CRP-like cAMP-binding protein
MVNDGSLQALHTALNRIYPLSENGAAVFLPEWQQWDYPKDHFVLREHRVADYIWFLEKGAIRIYYNKEEKEVTEWLALDDQFFMSITSFFQRVPSRLIIQTLEPSSIWGIHHDTFMKLADEHHEIERMLRMMVTGSLILSQQRMEAIQFETAQQRYQRLLQDAPDIVSRVSGLHLASFLGITKETLSRIRGMQ